MKKIIKLFSLIGIIFVLTGCINKDSMEDITIYTSVYPIEYVTERLYGNHANVVSFYPSESNPYEYKLTKKQIKDYSTSNLIVYNGLDKEKDYIVEMINNNKNLKIIDATARIEYQNSMDEIWINPSSLLTIAQNVKNGFKEYVTSSYLQDEIDNNYDKLKLEISTIDAEMKEMVANAENKTIVVSSNDLTFLSKYGFNVISLDDSTVTDKIISDTKKLINNKQISYIYMKNNEEENSTIKSIKQSYHNVEILKLNTLNTISAQDKANKKDYISIMYDNIDNLKKELY